MKHIEPEPEQRQEAKRVRKGPILALVCLSHATNHLQSGVVSVLYPLLRQEFGFSYLGIGFLETISQMVASVLQVTYGFLARFVGRGILLGIGNIVGALGTLTLGFSRGYPHLVAGVGIRSLGSSAQHPVGAATLASHFPDKRARVLGFHEAGGNVGAWIAPILASSLLLVMGWRQVLWIVAVASLLMGVAYFAFRELMAPVTGQSNSGQRRNRAFAALADYRVVLKNRNVLFLTLAMLAGAAGRGTNVLTPYLTTYLVDRYHIAVPQAGMFFASLLFGGIVGPIVVGWLADRFSHKFIAQFTLLATGIFIFTIIFHPSASWVLAAHLLLTGIFMYARGPLMETLFIQSSDKATLDTRLSIYYLVATVTGPLWTMVAGIVIDRFGFTPAFAVMGVSYLIGMLFLSFVKFEPTANDLIQTQ